MSQIKWEKSLTEKDIAASAEFLRLIFDEKEVERMASKFEKNRHNVQRFKAKDILRASKTQLLPETNEDVRAEFVKIVSGKRLVPIALVRRAGHLFIADGYHRTCAAYYLDKEAEVHCVLVGVE